MDPFSAGVWIWALWKASEKVLGKILEKGFDAAGEPVKEGLSGRFKKLAGQDEASRRRAAFVAAAETARDRTIQQAGDSAQTVRILHVLDDRLHPQLAETLAEESVKVLLLSDEPNVVRLATLFEERLRYDQFWRGEARPTDEAIRATIATYLHHLHETLLDKPLYSELLTKEQVRLLRGIYERLPERPHRDNEAIYRQQLARMNRQLEFVGIPELKERRPITIRDIFVRLRVQREVEWLEDAELMALDEAQSIGTDEVVDQLVMHGGPVESIFQRPGQLTRYPDRVEKDVAEALRDANRLVLLGDPGSGKTTLLKFLAVLTAESETANKETAEWLSALYIGDTPPLPIFIRLREFVAETAQRKEDYDLLDYLRTHARERLLVHLPRDLFRDALEAGRCVLCLDGLDEIWEVGERVKVRDAVKALAARFPRNRFLVTSRLVGYDEAPLDRRDFAHYTVLPLRDEEIRDFVRRWYELRELDPIRRDLQISDLIATIEQQPRIQSLARNPLLLTIIALVHRIEAVLPQERVKLYDKCVTALIDTWDEVRGLTVDHKQQPFFRARRRLLEQLAFHLHTHTEQPGRAQAIREGDLEMLLTRYLLDDPEMTLAGKPNEAREEARAFLSLAKARTGLLVERGEGVFAFPHLTFQEYLAASDIERRTIHEGVVGMWQAIQPHLMDSHWREVILLLIGSLGKYDRFPTLLVERLLQAGEIDPYEPVLHRYLYFAARVLTDKVSVATHLHNEIIESLLDLASTNLLAQQDAFEVLAAFTNDHRVVEGLSHLAHSESTYEGVRLFAARTLVKVGDKAEAGRIVSQLLGKGSKIDDRSRLYASFVLIELGLFAESRQNLLQLLEDRRADTKIRHAAAWKLGESTDLFHPEISHSLVRVIKDTTTEEWLRRAAIGALGKTAIEDVDAFNILTDILRDSDGETWVRVAAAKALLSLGYIDEVRETLTELTDDRKEKVGVRRAAAQLLGEMGCVNQARQLLIDIARDVRNDEGIRRAAIRSTGIFEETPEVVQTLRNLVNERGSSIQVVRDAAISLGVLSYTTEATRVLENLIHASQLAAGSRRVTAQALFELGAETVAVDVLLQLATDRSVKPGVRRDTVRFLGTVRTVESVASVILGIAQDETDNLSVRRTAYESLKRIVGA